MRCEKCHKEAPDDAVFCPYCGRTFGSGANSAGSEYAAFISYRHVSRDQEVAKHVQRAIETYRLPRGAGQDASHGKLGKCFRDEDELAAASSLPARIVDALEKSSSLIVICSPDVRDSIWVNREIDAFIEMHGRDRIFAVLASGSSDESIPPSLKTERAAMGGTGTGTGAGTGTLHANPLAADLRPEASDRKKEETLRIIAAVAGCGFDELRQRDKLRRRKRGAIIAAAAVALIALIAALVFTSIMSNREAQISESHKLAEESAVLFERGDRYGALEKALAALPSSDNAIERPVVEEARQALVDALEIEAFDKLCWRPNYLIELENDVKDLVTEPEHNWFAVMDSSITVSTYDYTSGKKLASFSPLDYISDESNMDVDSMPQYWKLLPAGDRIIIGECAGSGMTLAFDARTGKSEWIYSPLRIQVLGTFAAGQVISMVALDENYILGMLADASNNEPVTWKYEENPTGLEGHLPFLPTVTDDDWTLFMGLGDRVVGFDFKKDEQIISASNAIGLDVVSVGLGQDSIVASSVSWLEKHPSTTDELERQYHFECLDREMNTLWTYDGTWVAKVEGEGKGLHIAGEYPKVYGVANLDRPYAICAVGDSLLLFDNSSGNLLYSEQFGSTIVSAATDGLHDSGYGDTVVVVCADGSVNFRRPFVAGGDNAIVLGFSFPSLVLQSAVEWTNDQKLLGLAVSRSNPNQVLCYRLDTRGLTGEAPDSPRTLQGPLDSNSRYIDLDAAAIRKPASSYTLEELVSLAKETLSEAGRR